MDPSIRPLCITDVDQVVELSLLAWSPVYTSFREILGSEVYEAIWPDWRASKQRSIPKLSREDSQAITFVAECDGAVVGFISYRLDAESKTGTVQYLAVHPDYQRKGIGTELNRFALAKMRESGMKMAVAETGGDRSHLPARMSYARAGYTGLPLVRYFKTL
jgi:predicted N-acetyltransferase YhbS